MEIVNLYRYENSGRVTVTPNKQNDNDKPSLYRVIAGEGKLVKKGAIETCAIDTENPDGWAEIIDENYIPFEEGDSNSVLPE